MQASKTTDHTRLECDHWSTQPPMLSWWFPTDTANKWNTPIHSFNCMLQCVNADKRLTEISCDKPLAHLSCLVMVWSSGNNFFSSELASHVLVGLLVIIQFCSNSTCIYFTGVFLSHRKETHERKGLLVQHCLSWMFGWVGKHADGQTGVCSAEPVRTIGRYYVFIR
jgi:hypothetical protein